MNTYTLDEITGELHFLRNEPKIEKVLGLFTYEKEEDVDQIERQYPIIFPSYESLSDWINNNVDNEFEEIIKANQAIVIRWIKLVR